MKRTVISKLKFVGVSLAMVMSLANAADWKKSEHRINTNQLIESHNNIDSFTVTGFPQEMLFRPLQVYGEQATVQVLSDQGDYELPKSNRLFFISVNATDKAAIYLDKTTGLIGGHVTSGKTQYHVHSRMDSNRNQFIKLTEENMEHDFSCDNENFAQWNLPFSDKLNINLNTGVVDKVAVRGGNPTYQAQIIADTDNEFLWDKFNNNTASARDWIEDLFANMNIIYESEVDLNLKIRNIILRVDTTPTGNPDFNQDPNGFNSGLNGFSNYWDNLNGNDSSVFTALLSGNSISSNSFSGVAWVNAYCSQRFGYSINRIGSNFPASIADLFVGHEIGHNLGSSHTHCEALGAGGSFVDQCYSNKNNCYVGPTSCVAGGVGTIMSYCHAPPQGFDGNGPQQGPPASPNCNTSEDMHPLIANKLDGRIAGNFPNCITSFQTDLIFANGFQ